MTDQCKYAGLERCGVDVKCGACSAAGSSCCSDPGDCQRDCESIASGTLEQPYFDNAGNQGTYDEVYS